MPDYYDLLLWATATSLLAGFIVGAVTSVAFHLGVLFGALVATIFVYEALFRNPPQPVTNRQLGTAAIAWHVFLIGLVIVTVVS